VKDSGGVVGPHTFFALPGQMLITGLSNDKDGGGKTGLVEYNNEGRFVRTVWMPEGAEYGYDARVQPRLNRMLTSSFTGAANYMRDFGSMLADPEAMKRFGNTVVVWDFHARKPIQTLEVPGAPLEIRWALQPRHNYAFTTAALTSKIWLVEQKDDGSFAAHASGEIIVGFSTANKVPRVSSRMTAAIEVLLDEACDGLYEAVVECTEEAIVNSLCMSDEMRGQSGHVAPALPLDLLTEILRNHRAATTTAATPGPRAS